MKENRDLPVCPFDGKPCLTPEKGCSASAFGVLVADGKSEVVWSCPRFKPDSVSRFR